MRVAIAVVLLCVVSNSSSAQTDWYSQREDPAEAIFSSNGDFRVELKYPRKSGEAASLSLSRVVGVGNSRESREIWSVNAGMSGPGVAAIVTDDGQFTVLINDLSGTEVTDTVILVYSGEGNLINAFGLSDIFQDTELEDNVVHGYGFVRWLDYEPFLRSEKPAVILPVHNGFLELDLVSAKSIISAHRPGFYLNISRGDAILAIYNRLKQAVDLAGSTAFSIEARRELSRMNYEIHELTVRISGLTPGLAPASAIRKKMDLLILEAAESYDSELHARLVENRNRANIAVATSKMRSLQSALAQYYLRLAEYPSTEDGLEALLAGEFRYVNEDMIVDPWGNQFVYRRSPADGVEYVLFSSGPDGIPGSADDIRTEW